ncbi:HSPB1 associated protein 1 isoform X1 [Nomia melanderi]|uniref:HSPB1 associated protein 1 isoform X1 n=2 Tax=Nomia melanderi TaxID=2448451 RepID=UPI003FCDF672
MEKLNCPSEEVLKNAILEIKEPLLFQRMLQNMTDGYTWKLLDWNLSQLVEKFGDIKLPFRIGCNAKTKGPQWEVNCPVISMTLSEFIKHINCNEDNKEWYYFDYKYMHEWFKDKPEIIDSVNWKRFGFEKTGFDSTLWIGSKGAHTNCHQDSYGCNLIAQIHGRKEWLLFPPSSSDVLHVTRVPYEESTVYSKYNFFCPTEEDEINILKMKDKAKVIILEPGDVLFVPAGWWHYVESLEFSVSVNTWLPIVTDSVSRVKEALVKLIVARIGKNLLEKSEEAHFSLSYCIKLLSVALGECKNIENIDLSHKKVKHTEWTADDLVEQYPQYVKMVKDLETSEMKELLRMKRKRFPNNSDVSVLSCTSKSDNNVQDTSIHKLSEDIINALCHPDVINKVTDILLSS